MLPLSNRVDVHCADSCGGGTLDYSGHADDVFAEERDGSDPEDDEVDEVMDLARYEMVHKIRI